MLDLFQGLSGQELIFIHEYLIDFNKKRAAEVAGINPRGLMGRQGISEAIARAIEERVKRLKINSDWVLNELVNLYETDMSSILRVDENGDLGFDFSELSDDLKMNLESINIKQGPFGPEVKIGLPTKLKVLDLIGKHVSVNAFKSASDTPVHFTLVFDKQDANA